MKELLEKVLEARAHTAVALSQAIPADDQIIIGHIREADAILNGVIAEIRRAA